MLWPNVHVEESSLAQNVFALRKALGRLPRGGAVHRHRAAARLPLHRLGPEDDRGVGARAERDARSRRRRPQPRAGSATTDADVGPLTTLAGLVVAAAFFAGRRSAEKTEPIYQKLTFRRGIVRVGALRTRRRVGRLQRVVGRAAAAAPRRAARPPRGATARRSRGRPARGLVARRARDPAPAAHALGRHRFLRDPGPGADRRRRAQGGPRRRVRRRLGTGRREPGGGAADREPHPPARVPDRPRAPRDARRPAASTRPACRRTEGWWRSSRARRRPVRPSSWSTSRASRAA